MTYASSPRLYGPASSNDSSPFRQKDLGGGPSTSEWSTKELTWLCTEYIEDCPIEQDTRGRPAIFDDEQTQYLAGRESRLFHHMQEAFGESWERLTASTPQRPHYDLLVNLSRPKSYAGPIFLAPSSSPPTFYSPPPAVDAYDTSHVDAPSSPPPTPSKPPSSTITPSAPLTGSQLPSGIASVSSPSTPSSTRTANLAANLIDALTTPPSATTRAATNLQTPVRPSPNPSFRASSSVADTLFRESLATTDTSDSSYVEGSSSSLRDDQTHLPHEYQVRTAADACLEALHRCVQNAAGSVFRFQRRAHEHPPNLRLLVEGLTITAQVDLTVTFQSQESDIGNSGKYARIHFEVKRLDHQQPPDKILAQEVGDLLCLAGVAAGSFDSKPRTASPSKSLSSQKSKRQEGNRLLQVHMFSWHHLTGYVTRLEVWSSRLAEIASGDSARGSVADPLRVFRSEEYDLTDADQRVRFFVAVVGMALFRLDKYSQYQPVVRRLLEQYTA